MLLFRSPTHLLLPWDSITFRDRLNSRHCLSRPYTQNHHRHPHLTFSTKYRRVAMTWTTGSRRMRATRMKVTRIMSMPPRAPLGMGHHKVIRQLRTLQECPPTHLSPSPLRFPATMQRLDGLVLQHIEAERGTLSRIAKTVKDSKS